MHRISLFVLIHIFLVIFSLNKDYLFIYLIKNLTVENSNISLYTLSVPINLGKSF